MNMSIQSNSRQVPTKAEIWAQKYYSDILYSHLQVISQLNPSQKRRYVPSDAVNFSALGEALGISRQTVSKRFYKLIELGLITKEDDGKVYLEVLEPQEAFLIPQETLRKLVSALSEKSVTIYTYLLQRYYANKGESFKFSITGLKDLCGLGIKTTSNNYIITDILEVLKKLRLIDYCVKTESDAKTGLCETHYYLTSATNVI